MRLFNNKIFIRNMVQCSVQRFNWIITCQTTRFAWKYSRGFVSDGFAMRPMSLTIWMTSFCKLILTLVLSGKYGFTSAFSYLIILTQSIKRNANETQKKFMLNWKDSIIFSLFFSFLVQRKSFSHNLCRQI